VLWPINALETHRPGRLPFDTDVSMTVLARGYAAI
jgi:hypothetical protein